MRLHDLSWNLTCVQSFRFVLFTVFEIHGLKLNNNNKEKILTLVIILWCQKWIIAESESVNMNSLMYRHNGPRPHPSLYTKYYNAL